jgi:hypothetical protein
LRLNIWKVLACEAPASALSNLSNRYTDDENLPLIFWGRAAAEITIRKRTV